LYITYFKLLLLLGVVFSQPFGRISDFKVHSICSFFIHLNAQEDGRNGKNIHLIWKVRISGQRLKEKDCFREELRGAILTGSHGTNEMSNVWKYRQRRFLMM